MIQNSVKTLRERINLVNSPTSETYQSLIYAYDFYNQALFNGTLPPVVFTYHRQNRVMGYASFQRWIDDRQQCVDEIAINPEYFAKFPLLEICQTLVHEMVHIWQAHHGKPGRRGYHNSEWAEKMENIGLIPSSTAKPGGAKTGEAMMDYVSIDGSFIKACRKLVRSGFKFPLIDRYPIFREESPIIAYDDEGKAVTLDRKYEPKGYKEAALASYKEDIKTVLSISPLTDKSIETPHSDVSHSATVLTTKPKPKSGRVKYICKGCQTFIWGKPNLNIGCLDCDLKFWEED